MKKSTETLTDSWIKKVWECLLSITQSLGVEANMSETDFLHWNISSPFCPVISSLTGVSFKGRYLYPSFKIGTTCHRSLILCLDLIGSIFHTTLNQWVPKIWKYSRFPAKSNQLCHYTVGFCFCFQKWSYTHGVGVVSREN